MISIKNLVKRLLYASDATVWIYPAFAFAAGYLVDRGSVNLQFIVGTVYFFGPYNLLLDGLERVFSHGNTQSRRKYHSEILFSVLLVNLPFVLFLLLVGNFLGSLVLSLLLFFAVSFSLPWLRLKGIPLIDSIVSSLHYVGPLIYAASLLPESNLVPVSYIVAIFLWGVANYAFTTVQTANSRKEIKMSSWGTPVGTRKTVWLSVFLYLIASILVIRQNSHYFILSLSGLLYVINLAPYLFVNGNTSYTVNEALPRLRWLNLFNICIIAFVLIVLRIKT